MTDADGNTIENENIILSGTKGKQKITVQKAGTYYLTYFIDEDEYNTADHRNQYAANLTVTRPTVKFIVEKVSLNNNADTNNPQINNITIPCTASAMRERVLSFSFYSSILPKLRSAKSSTRSVRLGATGAAFSASRGV